MKFLKRLLAPEKAVAAVAPVVTIKPVKVLDISEPVIKLLAMLDEDVWEPSTCSKMGENGSGCSGVIFGVRHIFKENLSIKVRKMWYSGFSYLSGKVDYQYRVYDHDWMTVDEREAIAEKIHLRVTEIYDLNRASIDERNRELYKQFLDTV